MPKRKHGQIGLEFPFSTKVRCSGTTHAIVHFQDGRISLPCHNQSDYDMLEAFVAISDEELERKQIPRCMLLLEAFRYAIQFDAKGEQVRRINTKFLPSNWTLTKSETLVKSVREFYILLGLVRTGRTLTREKKKFSFTSRRQRIDWHTGELATKIRGEVQKRFSPSFRTRFIEQAYNHEAYYYDSTTRTFTLDPFWIINFYKRNIGFVEDDIVFPIIPNKLEVYGKRFLHVNRFREGSSFEPNLLDLHTKTFYPLETAPNVISLLKSPS